MGTAQEAGRVKLIYFLRRSDGVGPVKIGCSNLPKSRLQAMQVWSPEPLEILASAPGGFTDEKCLHRRFAAHRLHGEWFEAAPQVLAAIARIAATGVLPRPLASDRSQRMAEMYRGGATLQTIGDEFGVTRERARQILRKSGVPSEGHRPEISRRSVAWRKAKQILALAAQGYTMPEIIPVIGDERHNINTVLREHGVALAKAKRPVLPQTMERAWKIAADYKGGLKIAEIAERHGIPASHIYRHLRYAGTKATRLPRRKAA